MPWHMGTDTEGGVCLIGRSDGEGKNRQHQPPKHSSSFAPPVRAPGKDKVSHCQLSLHPPAIRPLSAHDRQLEGGIVLPLGKACCQLCIPVFLFQ